MCARLCLAAHDRVMHSPSFVSASGLYQALGLFIVQQIVHAHEGSISVESTPRQTCFTVFIPIP